MRQRFRVTTFTAYGFGIGFDDTHVCLCFWRYRLDFYYKRTEGKV